MKSNPYVYPSKDFFDLENKNFKNNLFGQKKIALKDVKKTIDKIKIPSISLSGKKTEEKILNLFLSEEIRFGEKSLLLDYKDFWLKKINYFVKKNKPLQFTILGFPFKVPLPLKTNRILPDMGEVLSLARLRAIGLFIRQNIYSPGAVINVFSEGSFGRFIGVKEEKVKKYEKHLKFLAEKLAIEDILKIRFLSGMEKDERFFDLFEKRKRENSQALKNKNSQFMKKFRGAYPSVFRIVDATMYSKEILMQVYDGKIKDENLLPRARAARKDIAKRTKKALIEYFAYLSVRDDLNFLEKSIPHYLALSVSPKPYRLGIIPVNKKIKILPYHGVPVFDEKTESWDIVYLVDLERKNERYKKAILKEENEKAPFYYQKF